MQAPRQVLRTLKKLAELFRINPKEQTSLLRRIIWLKD